MVRGRIIVLALALIAVAGYILWYRRLKHSWPKKISSMEGESGATTFQVFVRSRQHVVPGILNNWVDWNSNLGGGPTLIVRADSFEVVAPQGMMLDSRDLVIESNCAAMWLDDVGWAGTPIGRKRSIHIAGRDQAGGQVELALSLRDGLEQAWQALLNSGVTLSAARSA